MFLLYPRSVWDYSFIQQAFTEQPLCVCESLSWTLDEKDAQPQLPALRALTAEELSQTDRRRQWNQEWGLRER